MTRFIAAPLTVVLLLTIYSDSFGDQQRPAIQNRDQLLDGLLNDFNRISSVASLTYDYTLTTTVDLSNTTIPFGWENIKSKVILKQAKTYLRVSCSNRNKEFPIDVEVSWDGSLGLSKDDPNKSFVIRPEIIQDQAIYLFMERVLYRKEACKVFNTCCSERMKYDLDSAILPDALLTYRAGYSLCPSLELVDGVWCHVLERNGVDRLWIDTENGYSLKRRDFCWPNNGGVREQTTYSAYQEVGSGIRFPTRIVNDQYAPPWDTAVWKGKVVNHQIFDVSLVEAKDVDEAIFRSLTPADGSKVFDARTKTRFTYHKGTTQFDHTLAEARQWPGQHNTWSLFLKVNIILIVVVASIVLVRKIISVFNKKQT